MFALQKVYIINHLHRFYVASDVKAIGNGSHTLTFALCENIRLGSEIKQHNAGASFDLTKDCLFILAATSSCAYFAKYVDILKS